MSLFGWAACLPRALCFGQLCETERRERERARSTVSKQQLCTVYHAAQLRHLWEEELTSRHMQHYRFEEQLVDFFQSRLASALESGRFYTTDLMYSKQV